MKIERLPPRTLAALRNRGFTDAHIETMTARNLFHQYCTWHGLIDWGNDLYDLAHGLAKLERKLATESAQSESIPAAGAEDVKP